MKIQDIVKMIVERTNAGAPPATQIEVHPDDVKDLVKEIRPNVWPDGMPEMPRGLKILGVRVIPFLPTD